MEISIDMLGMHAPPLTAAVRFSVPGRPVAKGRPRFVVRKGRGRALASRYAAVIADPVSAGAEQLFAAIARQHRPTAPFVGPVFVELTFVDRWPKAATKAHRLRPYVDVKPDLDNLDKLVLDALSKAGYFAVGDGQVAHLVARKMYDVRPRTLVLVGSIAENAAAV